MSTTARLGIDIVATNRTRNGFAATQRGLAGINRSMQQLKVLAGAFAGGNLLAGFVRSITSINAKVPEVSAAFTTLQRAWQAFALAIGEAGFSRALIDFATRMSTLVVGSNGLAQALSRLMSGTLSVLGGAFEGVARAINFAYDNFEILKRALYAFAAVQVAGGIFTIAQGFLKYIMAVRAAGFATITFSLITRRMLGFWLVFIAIGAKVAGVYDLLAEKVRILFKWAEGLLPEVTGTFAEALRAMGFEVQALTQDFGAFEGQIAGLPQTFAEVNAQAKALEKVGKPVNLLEGVKELQTSMDNLIPTMQQGRDLLHAFLDGVINGFVQGQQEGKGFIDTLRGIFDSIFTASIQTLGNYGGERGFGKMMESMQGGVLSMFMQGINFGSFGGFFAGGGHLGAGKWGIAGERGPEIVHGPANISPMGGMAVTVIDQRRNAPAIEQSTMPDGSLKLLVRDQVKDVLNGDDGARILRGRYGVTPPVKKR